MEEIFEGDTPQTEKFEMVAKTLKGLEEVLAEELRGLGAEEVQPGRRMVSFTGDKEMLYKANLCCRTALRILKPFYSFTASDPDILYETVKEYDWGKILSLDKTFCIDTVVNSDDFTHSHFVTYRVKDGIVDWFRDRYGADKRPGVRLKDADVMINVHISGDHVTLSLDSSGESLHKRGYRVAQTEAPINEVLAAGIILLSGWRGESAFVDPMCGSGTFLVEAALIAANINPGIYRKSFAFENWPDFDADLFDSLYNDESGEREVTCPIIGSDISAKAIEIATANIKSAGVGKYVDLKVMPISQWEEAPLPAGVVVTNPPYGERISAPDMEGLYATIGNRLKHVFKGYHAWIIGYREEYFHSIGLGASQKVPLMNGSLDCELREYIIFEGDKRDFLASGGRLKPGRDEAPRRAREEKDKGPRKFRDREEGGEKKYKAQSAKHKDDGRGRDSGARDDRRGRDDRRERDSRGRDERRERDFRSRDDRRERDFRDRKRDFKERDRDAREEEPENPLAKRRNPAYLRAITNKRPTLPPSEAESTRMRSRGWKKK